MIDKRCIKCWWRKNPDLPCDGEDAATASGIELDCFVDKIDNWQPEPMYRPVHEWIYSS